MRTTKEYTEIREILLLCVARTKHSQYQYPVYSYRGSSNVLALHHI